MEDYCWLYKCPTQKGMFHALDCIAEIHKLLSKDASISLSREGPFIFEKRNFVIYNFNKLDLLTKNPTVPKNSQ